jgi:hypothetical protein
MKELPLNVLNKISGAGGAPATAANSIGAAMITGALAGVYFGPWGMVGSAALAGIYTSIGLINSNGPVLRF